MDNLTKINLRTYGPENWAFQKTMESLKEVRNVMRNRLYDGMTATISSGDVLRIIRNTLMTISSWEVSSVESDIDSLDRATGIATLRKCAGKWIH